MKKTILLDKKQANSFKLQLRALKIHKRIYNAKKEILDSVFARKASEELGKRFKRILDEEKPSIKEIVVLRRFFGFDENTSVNDLSLNNLYINNEVDKTKIQKIKEVIGTYSSMEEMFGRVLKKELQKFNPGKKGGNNLVVYLSKDYDLYMEPKERHCYRIKSKQFFTILMFLDYEYKSTENICYEVGAKNNVATRKTINKLNDQIKTRLKISDFIQSKQNFGYKINERYAFVKD
jgi:ABC-type ATPase with predicted acetyltransferase domain